MADLLAPVGMGFDAPELETEEEKQRKREQAIQNNAGQGYYIDTLNKTSYSGAPQTQEERDWISDFILRNGRLPADVEMTGYNRQYRDRWNQGQYETYLPGSTMYELGYRTGADTLNQEPGGTQGPYSGSLVDPFGSVVITDASGRALLRTRNPENYTGEMQQGRFIRNPNDFSRDFSEFPGGQEGVDAGAFYKQIETPKAPARWMQPELEDALNTNIDDIGRYKLQVQDYITAQVNRDALKANKIDEQLALAKEDNNRGDLSDKDYREAYAALSRMKDELWTEQRADSEIKRIAAAMASNTDINSLPYYNESKGVQGKYLLDWYNKFVADSRKAFDGSMQPEAATGTSGTRSSYGGTSYGGTSTRTTTNNYNNYPQTPAQAQNPNRPRATGEERVKFSEYVQKGKYSYNAQRWLYDNYMSLYYDWQASGSPDQTFIEWVNDYLANGGYMDVPAYQRGEYAGRIAPRTRALNY